MQYNFKGDNFDTPVIKHISYSERWKGSRYLNKVLADGYWLLMPLSTIFNYIMALPFIREVIMWTTKLCP